MNYPNPPIWSTLTKRQQTQVIAILAQMVLRQLAKKDKEERNYVNRNPKGSS